jgi:hypothetical protein
MEFYFFSDFSLQKFLSDNNVIGVAKGLVLYKLLDVLGIPLDLKENPCDRGTSPYIPRDGSGWNNGKQIKLKYYLKVMYVFIMCLSIYAFVCVHYVFVNLCICMCLFVCLFV